MRKLTHSEFIGRCIDAWGDRYDLSDVSYTNSRDDIIVKCRDHGAFTVKAKNFAYSSSGCPACGGQKSRTTDEFLMMVKSIHGDRYDYSKVEYKRYDLNVSILCHEHGEFQQQPLVHLRGANCPKCSGVSKVGTKEFIERAIEVFGDTYDYSKTNYTTALNKLIVSCEEHGDFWQYPHNHLAGRGCRKCAMKKAGEDKRMTATKAEAECSKRGLRLVSYAGFASGSSEIACKLGHTWHAPLSRITRGSGCPVCAVSGYNPKKTGYVYVLVSDCKTQMKIGLSNNPKSRIRMLRSSTPFKFSLYGVAKMSGALAPKFETSMHKKSISAGLSGFDGCTEWFLLNSEVASHIRRFNELG